MSAVAPMLSPPEVAKRLRVKPDKVIGWIRSGRLRAVDVGNGRRRPRFRIDPADLADFLESRQVQAPARRGRRPRAPAPAYAVVYSEE